MFIITWEVFTNAASIMYSKMTKKQLEQEYGKRGIVYSGLDKKELVKRLQEHEEVEGSEYEEVENDGEGSDEEQKDDGDNDGGENDGGNAAVVSDGQMKLSLLKAEERRRLNEREWQWRWKC